MDRLKSFIAYLIVIVGIYIPYEFSHILIAIWSLVVFLTMLGANNACTSKVITPINPQNIPIKLKMKYDVFYSYWTNKHLPSWMDAGLYTVIIVGAGLREMWFISTTWLMISYFDFKIRDMALKEQSELIAYAMTKGVGK